MGVGLWTSEELKYDKSTGRLLTDRTWTYKPPGAKDIPVDFRIMFRRNSVNTAGVLRSKGTFCINIFHVNTHQLKRRLSEIFLHVEKKTVLWASYI